MVNVFDHINSQNLTTQRDRLHHKDLHEDLHGGLHEDLLKCTLCEVEKNVTLIMSWTFLCTSAVGAIVGGISAIGIYFRPIPDCGSTRNVTATIRYRTMDLRREPLPLLAARSCTMAFGAACAKLLIHLVNSLEIVDNSHYRAWLDAIRNRPPGTPLITVANHGLDQLLCLDHAIFSPMPR